MRKLLELILIFFSFTNIIIPQENIKAKDLSEMTLEELSKVEISVASKTALSMREAPGIVSLITKEEIQKSGARDLIDILRLIPGIEFGIDVRSITSIGIRGNWAHEGKTLLLWDGQIMNEFLFQTIQLGSHYPVDLIERIEIIRGPGSAIYGGNAELGVINIISSPAASINGISANSNFGWMAKAVGHEMISIAAGRKTENYDFDFSLFTGNTNRSDRILTDYHPDNPNHSYNMVNQNTLTPFFFSIGFNTQELKGRFIIDKYRVTDRSIYGINKATVSNQDFNTYIADLQYNWQISDDIQITPRLTYSQNSPWHNVDLNYSTPVYLDKWCERFSAGCIAKYILSSGSHLLAGVEFFNDRGHSGDSTYFLRNPFNKDLDISNYAVFAQGLFNSEIVNVTSGIRFENNSVAGSSLVPRIVFTKIINGFHIKALYSFAFRSPGIENISRYSTTPISPEKTTVSEIESGYQFSNSMSFTANFYKIKIKDPIVFFVDPVLKVSAYHNGSRAGTLGLEAEFRLKTGKISSIMNYSYYKADNNEVPDYVVFEDPNMMLGFPQHKITLNTTYFFTSGFSANITGTYLSKRYFDNDVVKKQFTEEPKLLLNCFFSFKDLFFDNFMVGFGVYDIMNSGYLFIQPYNGGSSPLPGPTREFLLKFSYQLDLGEE